jgi:hypothetical protein
VKLCFESIHVASERSGAADLTAQPNDGNRGSHSRHSRQNPPEVETIHRS